MPGVNYVLNLSGMTLSEERMKDIPFPRLEMVTHVTAKTIQSGAFIGTAMVAPIMAYKRGETDMQGMSKWVQKCGTRGVQIGFIAGPLLTYAALKSASLDSIADRSYRLRHNRNQVRVDRLALVGLAAGAGAALQYGQEGAFGALAGMTGGLLLGFVYNTFVG